MNQISPKNKSRSLIIVAVVVLAIIAGLVGWKLGHSNSDNASTNATSTSPKVPSSPNDSAADSSIDALVSYSLPSGWISSTCTGKSGNVFIVPNSASLDCSANPSAPIKLYVDPQNNTDCQQLGNVQGVKKHVCISLYIDGHKSLKASTTYPKSSTYATETTVSDYYINTGKGVVAVEYTYTSNNSFQLGFDQFVNRIKIK
ncbi:MAG: hypothetical protein ABI354_02565 [Candidatus Saccharimonadales bacterium]